jgi:hypothetical protein
MRSSEKQKQIDSDPVQKLCDLKRNKLTGRAIELKNGRVWIDHVVKKGVDHYKVYDPTSKQLRVIKKGIAK